MSVSVTMPRLGESVSEGTVIRWLKKEGEQVEADEPLLEVSTDKVDTEIPAPASGVLSSIRVGEDETVEVGVELAVIEDAAGGGGAGGGAPAPQEQAAQRPSPPQGDGGGEDSGAYVTPLVRKLAAEHGVDLAGIKGTGVGGRIRKQDVIAAAEAAKAATAAPAPAAAAVTAGGAASSARKTPVLE